MKYFDSIPILKDIPMFIGCAPLFDSLNCMFCLCNKKKWSSLLLMVMGHLMLCVVLWSLELFILMYSFLCELLLKKGKKITSHLIFFDS